MDNGDKKYIVEEISWFNKGREPVAAAIKKILLVRYHIT